MRARNECTFQNIHSLVPGEPIEDVVNLKKDAVCGSLKGVFSVLYGSFPSLSSHSLLNNKIC